VNRATCCNLVSLLIFLTLASLRILAIEPPSPAAYGVRLEKTWIPMKDGIRLAATLCMPRPVDAFRLIHDSAPLPEEVTTYRL